MAYYTEIGFDQEYFISEFKFACEMAHLSTVFDVIGKLSGDDTWINAYSEQINEQYSIIATDSIKAFINIYGSGKSMASENDNPFLKDYKQSEAWNPDRPNNGTVMYRPKSYKGLDWEHDLNKLVDRNGSGKTGVYKGFQDTQPDLSKMTKVLELYTTTFYENLNEEIKDRITSKIHSFFIQYSSRNKV